MYDVDVFQDEENEDFLSISRAMEEIVDDPIDCYWLIKCFVNQFHMKFGDSVPHLVKKKIECSQRYKAHEDSSCKFSAWNVRIHKVLVSFASRYFWICVIETSSFLFCFAAKEPGALSESGGASTAEPSEEQRRSGSAAVRPLVQTLLRWLPARIQPAEVSSPRHIITGSFLFSVFYHQQTRFYDTLTFICYTNAFQDASDCCWTLTNHSVLSFMTYIINWSGQAGMGFVLLVFIWITLCSCRLISWSRL